MKGMLVLSKGIAGIAESSNKLDTVWQPNSVYLGLKILYLMASCMDA